MIIAFDGNVFSGKTSLIRTLAPLCDSNIIDEHSFFLKTEIPIHAVTNEETAISLQLKYIDAENRRQSKLNAKKLNLLDRSFVSMAAHVFTLNSVQKIDMRDWFLMEIEKRMKLGEAIIPDIFCFIKCSHKTIQKRALVNQSRSTDKIYYKDDYLSAIERFNQMWIDKVKGITIDTNTVIPIRLAKNLIQQIQAPCQGEFDVHRICGYLQDLLKQNP